MCHFFGTAFLCFQGVTSEKTLHGVSSNSEARSQGGKDAGDPDPSIWCRVEWVPIVCFQGIKDNSTRHGVSSNSEAVCASSARKCAAPTALGTRWLCVPALPGGANFCRAYGAPIEDSGFSHRLLRPTLSMEPRVEFHRDYVFISPELRMQPHRSRESPRLVATAAGSGPRLTFRARNNTWQGDARRSTDRSVCATKGRSIVKEQYGARRESRDARSVRKRG